MTTCLRDYQVAAIQYVEQNISATPRILFASPTGTGKSYIINELRYQAAMKLCYVVSPKIEILEAMGRKCGLTGDPECWGYYTPIRLRNLLAKGEVEQPHRLIIDEVHHSTANSYQELIALANPKECIGFTATPYRGTPKGTKELLDFWGEPVWCITYPEAAERGYISIPNFSIVPLIDDDVIKVTGGEFQVTGCDEVIVDHITAIVEMCRQYFEELWDRSTMISVPSVESASVVQHALAATGIPANIVTGETTSAYRKIAFANCVDCTHALIQINVVSEGIDLPIRRIIDLRPTMSPVFWLQMLGRSMRPVKDGEEAPEYICCNRNLLRHAYVLDGLVPGHAIKAATDAFGGMGSRKGLRVLGFESLGRFVGTEIPLADGTVGLMYAVSTVSGHQVTEYCVICTPRHSEPVCAMRLRKSGTFTDKWQRCSMPVIDRGFSSVPARPISEKHMKFWKRNALHRGLNPDVEVNSRQAVALGVLLNTSRKLV
jgi:hypothetical protein